MTVSQYHVDTKALLLVNFTWSVHFSLHGLSRPNLGYGAYNNLLLEMMILGLGQVRQISVTRFKLV